MNIPDIINGSFEALSGLSTFWNCRILYRDKQVQGVDWRVTLFFISWGLWNLFYYPHLHQWVSLVGGVAIVTANIIWVCMALYYKRQNNVTF